MFTHAVIYIERPDDLVEVKLGEDGSGAPIIRFGGFFTGPLTLEVQLTRRPGFDHAEWLESFAASVLDLAGQVRERDTLDGAA